MKKSIKIISNSFILLSLLCIGQVTANAEWKQDNTGWWYADGNSWKTGWFKDTDNKWYYFNNEGYMVKNTNINGYRIDNNGVWIQNTNINSNNVTTNTNNINSNNTNNIVNNVNNGVINNTSIINNNVYVDNLNKSNIDNSNNTSSDKEKSYNGKNGFVKIDDDKYQYYEGGQVVKNTWKKFDEGYRHFDKDGYLDFYKEVDGLGINNNGLIILTNKYPFTKKQIFRDLQPYSHRGTVFEYGNLDYIIKTYNIFGIEYSIEYTNVYNKQEDGEILSINNKFINFDDNDEGKFEAKKIIQIGKYKERLDLN